MAVVAAIGRHEHQALAVTHRHGEHGGAGLPGLPADRGEHEHPHSPDAAEDPPSAGAEHRLVRPGHDAGHQVLAVHGARLRRCSWWTGSGPPSGRPTCWSTRPDRRLLGRLDRAASTARPRPWCGPASTDEVAEVVAACSAAGVRHRPQGGNTGLVGGGVPLHGEVVMSLTPPRRPGRGGRRRGPGDGRARGDAGPAATPRRRLRSGLRRRPRPARHAARSAA